MIKDANLGEVHKVREREAYFEWLRTSIDPRTSCQPLIQSRLMLKYGLKAREKSPNPVFLKTKTEDCNRPSQNWVCRQKNWGRTVVPKFTGTRASQRSCTIEVHGIAPDSAQLLASRNGRAHPAIDHVFATATSSYSFGPRGFIKPSFLLEFQY